MKKHFIVIAIILFASNLWAQENLYPIKIGNLYGYMNHNGKRIIRAQYDSASYFFDGLAAVKNGHRWGYINEADSFVISPIYTIARDFADGIAAVRYRSSEGDTTVEFNGYVKTDGKYLLPLSEFMSTTNSFHQGRALIQDRQQEWTYYVIDRNGKRIFKFDGVHIPAPDTTFYSEGKMHIIAFNRNAYIDTMGNNVFVADYNMTTGDFHESVAWIKDGNRYGFIDTLSRQVIPMTSDYTGVGDFHEKLCIYRIDQTFNYEKQKYEGGKAGFIDHTGTIVIQATFEDVGDFHDGVARVKTNGKWGFVDHSGKIVLPAIYDQAGDFFRELAPVILEGVPGYVDHKGKFISPGSKKLKG